MLEDYRKLSHRFFQKVFDNTFDEDSVLCFANSDLSNIDWKNISDSIVGFLEEAQGIYLHYKNIIDYTESITRGVTAILFSNPSFSKDAVEAIVFCTAAELEKWIATCAINDNHSLLCKAECGTHEKETEAFVGEDNKCYMH